MAHIETYIILYNDLEDDIVLTVILATCFST